MNDELIALIDELDVELSERLDDMGLPEKGEPLAKTVGRGRVSNVIYALRDVRKIFDDAGAK
jgi:hypothetical protein